MENKELIPFYSKPEGFQIELIASKNKAEFIFRFNLIGKIAEIKLPNVTSHPKRVEGLYQTTCFEVFIANQKGNYLEWNFSPSRDWCTFGFETYRIPGKFDFGRETILKQNFVRLENRLEVEIVLSAEKVMGLLSDKTLHASATAIVETVSGEKNYYAPLHPKDKPDFHDLKGFTIAL